ncbi:MAG TPA: CotH kinase family protein [Solirubrobacterales bacterium]
MDRPRLILAAALALLGLGALAPAARAALSAESMLAPTTVTAIDLQLPPASLTALEAKPDEYVEGTFRIAESGGTPASVGEFSSPLTVGIRLKGGSGSFKDLDGKAAFKVKFNEFVAKQKFLGLKSLTLNNMVQDPSMVHEVLTYEAFRAAGIAAPNAGYAYVHLNGIDYGLHLNLESMDDVALEKRFGAFDDPQHLYEGGPLFELVPGGAGAFEVDEGDDGDLSDLEALIAAANEPEPDFSTRMAPVADLAQMVRFWAAERYLGHWDGYSSREVNNYYLYSDQDGIFQMLPWGTDQALDHWWHSFSGNGGMLFDQCLDEEVCLAAYEEDLAEVAATTKALGLEDQVDQLAALLAPWQELEAEESTRAPYDADQIAAGIEAVHTFLAKRPGMLKTWLNLGPDEPDSGGEDDQQGPKGPALPPPLPTLPATLANRVEIDRSKLGRGLAIVRVEATGPGTISLAATTGPPNNRRRACTIPPRPIDAGPNTLTCRLSVAVRERLRLRPMSLRLTIGFQSAGGEPPLTLTRQMRLPREAG